MVLMIVIVWLQDPVPKTKNSPRMDVTVVIQSTCVKLVKGNGDAGICAVVSSALVLDTVRPKDSTAEGELALPVGDVKIVVSDAVICGFDSVG